MYATLRKLLNHCVAFFSSQQYAIRLRKLLNHCVALHSFVFSSRFHLPFLLLLLMIPRHEQPRRRLHRLTHARPLLQLIALAKLLRCVERPQCGSALRVLGSQQHRLGQELTDIPLGVLEECAPYV